MINYLKKTFYLIKSQLVRLVSKKHPTFKILVIGSGRSGTTWLQNLINYKREFRTCFEPYHPDNGIIDSTYRRIYTSNTGFHSTSLINKINLVLDGRFYTGWIDQDNRVYRYSSLLIKDVTSHFMLNTIIDRPDIKIVFMIRSPFDAVRSRIIGNWLTPFDDLQDQGFFLENPAFENIYLDFQSADFYGRNVLWWLLENKYVLDKFSHSLYVLRYDDLKASPENTLEKLSQYLGFNLQDAMSSINKKSKVTRSNKIESSVDEEILAERVNFYLQKYNMGDYL